VAIETASDEVKDEEQQQAGPDTPPTDDISSREELLNQIILEQAELELALLEV
jgi:hypothetical protein